MLRAAADGHRVLCVGQGTELSWTRQPEPLGPGPDPESFRRKTAPAFEVALRIGAILAGQGPALRDVLGKSIETYDVTEFYQDLTSRLRISERTRARLYTLLEKTTDVKERLKILKEIRRLSEEIETIKMTLKTIERLISFSRITIQLEQRLADISYEDKGTIPFSWIAEPASCCH